MAIATNEEFDNGVIWDREENSVSLWGKVYIDELKKVSERITEK